MRKRLCIWLCMAALCCAFCLPARVQAVEPLDPQAEASLTLYYQKEQQAFADLTVQLHRVASAREDGTFALIPPYASYPVNIYGITSQQQWKNIAQTLSAYIVAEQVQPDRVGLTDAEGVAHFSDLETGLYLVREVVAQKEDGTYIFDEFMVYLPTPQPEGGFDYAMEAKPKCVEFIPKTHYTVTKLWQDEGHQEDRPEEVTVEIYQDGVLWETQILNSDNQWSYHWTVSGENTGTWTVVERSLPEPYVVTIQENNGVFSIINTWQIPPTPPETGDSRTLFPWVIAMSLSGTTLLLLGMAIRRRE